MLKLLNLVKRSYEFIIIFNFLGKIDVVNLRFFLNEGEVLLFIVFDFSCFKVLFVVFFLFEYS